MTRPVRPPRASTSRRRARRRHRPRTAPLAQDPDTGWAAIAPWIVPDPGGSIESWRAALRADGGYLQVAAADPATGALHLAFVDSRDANRRVFHTRSDDRGARWRLPIRIDARERDPVSPDATLTNEWSPRVIAHGDRVVVAYTHRERPDPAEQPSWDAHVVESPDGGAGFEAPQRIDAGGFPERIAADPAIVLDASGQWQLAFSTYRGTKVDSDIALASSSTPGLAFAPEPRDAWWPALAALPDGGVAVAWQDFRSGGNDIYVARAGAAAAGASTTAAPPMRRPGARGSRHRPTARCTSSGKTAAAAAPSCASRAGSCPEVWEERSGRRRSRKKVRN